MRFLSILTIPFISHLLFLNAKADIILSFPTDNPGYGLVKKVFIFNEKTKRLTYIDMKANTDGTYAGRVVVDSVPEGIARFYRIGEPSTEEKRYFSFKFREKNKDLIIDLNPKTVLLSEVQRFFGTEHVEEKPVSSAVEEASKDASEDATGGVYYEPNPHGVVSLSRKALNNSFAHQDWKTAKTQLESLLSINGANLNFHTLLAFTESQLKNCDQSKVEYEKGLADPKEMAKANYNLGLCYQSNGKTIEASKYFEKVSEDANAPEDLKKYVQRIKNPH